MTKSVYLKNDLNLMPKREGPSTFKKNILPMIVFCAVLVAALAAGIIIPQKMLADKQKEKEELQLKTAQLSTVQAEFEQLNSEINVITNRLKIFDVFKSSGKELSDMLDTVEKACPDTVRMTEIRFDYEKIYLSGICADDAEAASFAVMLRESGLFAEVNIDTVQFENVYVDDAEQNEVLSDELRAFEIQLYYPVLAG